MLEKCPKIGVRSYLNDNPRTWLPDQDALNAIFSGKTLLIDEKWNYFIDEARKIMRKQRKKYIIMLQPC